ncbi:type II toxin-antitoxin system Phd/YefM family antitoxin [Kutzneria chonburiensis]|uniref:Antitoxin n=1 Tax=Kutzneria chonburiensis TaxID=1483604 RepID=A0ABV6N2S1_9PSEU
MNVGVRELRDKLSRYLAEVRAGRTLTVTRRGRPIAQIVPVQRPTTLDQLIAEGQVRPSRSYESDLPPPAEGTGSGSELVVGQWR